MNRITYPLLPRQAAKQLYLELYGTPQTDWEAVDIGPRLRHPAQKLPALGGIVATPSKIEEVRISVIQGVNVEINEKQENQQNFRNLDGTLGIALYAALELNGAQSGSEDMWSFLSLVVFPDIVWHRFATPIEERALGKPRNVLRRVWYRERIFGDLLREGNKPLGEDELVGLLERSRLSRNRRLIRVLAEEILALEGVANRSYFVRELMKEIAKTTGPRLLDALSEGDLRSTIKQTIQRTRESMECGERLG
ncbi:hypothetical protein [Arthrobacter sp. AOP36-C1-22]|uniref:hypothetical protein n=1 Tax=Arthrobacter sp. AOP36-C1-22 TaxID=3457683 RepID=UPI00403460A7